MTSRIPRSAILAGVIAVAVALSATGVAAKKKLQHVGASTEVSTSTIKGKKSIAVTGLIQSSVARCERQRSILIYEAGASGNISGPSIGHAVSEGGSQRGQFTITGLARKKILSDREFIVEAVARNVKVKGRQMICKRSVSVEFPGTFG